MSLESLNIPLTICVSDHQNISQTATIYIYIQCTFIQDTSFEGFYFVKFVLEIIKDFLYRFVWQVSVFVNIHPIHENPKWSEQMKGGRRSHFTCTCMPFRNILYSPFWGRNLKTKTKTNKQIKIT